jgi:hypothetical protein
MAGLDAAGLQRTIQRLWPAQPAARVVPAALQGVV